MVRRATRRLHPLHGRHELLWEGKYDARGRLRVPEVGTPGLSLETAELYPARGEYPAIPKDWRNRLVLGDNREAIACLLPELRGAVQLVYLDPPFGSEADYVLQLPTEPASARVRTLAYEDRWRGGTASYLSFMAERLTLMRELLAPQGCLFLHCDWHNHASLRLVLDEIFGADHFVNEIVWHYYNKYSRGKHCLPRAHDTVLVYGRTRTPAIYPIRLKRDVPQRQLLRRSVGGVLRNARDAEGRLMYQVVHDKKADDVWRIPQLQPASPDWTGFATQKHALLLERIVALASRPGDLVADFFCGTGTTLAVAQRMERRFVGCDLGLHAVQIARRRLLQAPAPRPALSLERVRGEARASLRRLAGGSGVAQRAWILERLGATPERAGHEVHGRLRGLATWVQAADAPLTARQALWRAKRVGASASARMICCAWEFEPAFWDRLDALGEGDLWSGYGANLLPVILPRDWLTLRNIQAAPLRILPRLHATAARTEQAPSAAASGVRVTLTGYEGPLLHEALEGKTPRDGLGAVESWGVDLDWRPGRKFTATWFAARPRGSRGIVASTPALSGSTRPRVFVQAWDALGVGASSWVPIAP